jgi:hypothetical protein
MCPRRCREINNFFFKKKKKKKRRRKGGELCGLESRLKIGSSPFQVKWRGAGPCFTRGKIVENIKITILSAVKTTNRLLSILNETKKTRFK